MKITFKHGDVDLVKARECHRRRTDSIKQNRPDGIFPPEKTEYVIPENNEGYFRAPFNEQEEFRFYISRHTPKAYRVEFVYKQLGGAVGFEVTRQAVVQQLIDGIAKGDDNAR